MDYTSDVLVVDDEANIVDLITEVLNEEGYRVRQAHDGTSALALIYQQRPAMVLLDLTMPDMVGTTLLQHIRSNGLADLPVIIMTAGSYSTDALAAQGATDYLPKPFELNDLIDCVARYTKASRTNSPHA